MRYRKTEPEAEPRIVEHPGRRQPFTVYVGPNAVAFCLTRRHAEEYIAEHFVPPADPGRPKENMADLDGAEARCPKPHPHAGRHLGWSRA